VIRASTLVKYCGLAWIWIALAFVLLGAGSTLYLHGFRRMLQLWSPFNPTNMLMIILILAPGLALLHWSEKLSDRPR
jgi:hypothetical protein